MRHMYSCHVRENNNIITHSDHTLFDLNALVSSLGGIMPSAYGLVHYSPLGLHSGI